MAKTGKEIIGKASPMDQFMDWVDRLPISPILFYPLVYAALVFLQHGLLWMDGTLQVGQFSPEVFVFNIWFVFISAAWHFLRATGEIAIRRFREALDLNEKETNRLIFEFTRIPRRAGWIMVAIAVPLTILALPYIHDYWGPLFFSPLTKFQVYVLMPFVAPMNFGFFWITFRCLFMIPSIYSRVKRINLFNLHPIYSLAAFTSRVGMIFVTFVLINVVTAPLTGDPTTTGWNAMYIILQSSIAILAFVLPLWGIHVRLVNEKAKVTEGNNKRLEDAFWSLQRSYDAGKLEEIPQLKTSFSAFMDFRGEIKRVPTWPWDTGTLRSFITALFVPLTVWTLQQILLRVVVK